MAASLVVLNVIPFFDKASYATAGVNITKTSTADFNQGTNSNLSTASDEMKMNPTARTAWYQTGGTWNYRKKIVIDHTKVPNTDQTDFPVLINLATDSDLASKAQDDGDDLLLTQEDQKTKLSHEIESFNGTTGALVLWVKIPSLSHIYDTTVYLYYGNASATSQQNKTDVWSNGYRQTYHLNEASWTGTTGEVKNSVSGTYNGTVSGATVEAAKIGVGGKYHSASDPTGTSEVLIDPPDPAYQPITMSAWVKHNRTMYGGDKSIISWGLGDWKVYRLYGGGASSYIFQSRNGPSTTLYDVSLGEFSQDTWHHVTVVQGDNVFNAWIDGNQVATNVTNENVTSSGYAPHYSLRIGQNWFGNLDEARISTVARSADWIATEYANQNSPASFYSVQAETAKSSVLIADDNISTDWYHTDWKYRRQITIDHTKVPSTDQTEFPMLVKIADSTDPIFTKAQADGDDLLFTNQYGNTKLSHEIETFSTETKELWAWVKIPILSTSVDTKIWLYYGNTGVQNQQNKTDVWSNGYVAVWHLTDPTDAKDSTVNANDLTNSGGSLSTGVIGKGVSFTSNATLKTDDISALPQFTAQSWFKTSNGNQQSYRSIISKESVWNNRNFWIGLDQGASSGVTGSVGMLWSHNSSMSGLFSSQRMDDDSWHQVAATWDGTDAALYVGGVQSGTVSGATPDQPTASISLAGAGGGLYDFLTGSEDEVRISSVARSADWIATEYANQNSPETFAQIGKEIGYYPASSTATWYGEGGAGQKWAYRQKITIDNANVPNTDQTDFPVLVKITDQANGIFDKAQADGDDIVFTANDQYTKLSHEIETFSNSSHELWAWVKVPTLTTATDTVLYMYYGNPNSPNQQNKTNVWTNGYNVVLHGSDDGSNALNSLGTNNFGPVAGTTIIDGKLGSAMQFNNNSITSQNNIDFSSGTFTAQMWIYESSTDASWPYSKANTGYTNQIRTFSDQSHIFYGADASQNVGFPLYSREQWALFTVSCSSSTCSAYKNSTVGETKAMTLDKSSQKVQIGVTTYGSGSPKIDEFKMSSVSRSADWIATEYANQSTPESFYDIDPEVADPGTGEWFPARGTWTGRQAITIDHTKVPNTDQTDFPVLIKIANQSNGVFSSAQADGDDILFTSADGKTKLSHEIETFDSTTAGSKALWAWVKVPTLSSSADTTLYIYYGNSTTTNQENSTDVWSNGYAGVWHLNETGANPVAYDSTANKFDSTSQTWTPDANGKVGGAAQFIKADHGMITTSLNSQSTDFTTEIWFNDPGGNGEVSRLLDKSYSGGFWLGLPVQGTGGSYGGGIKETNNPYGIFVTLPTNQWNHIASTRSGTTHSLIGNGGVVTTSNTVSSAALSSDYFSIAGPGDAYYWMSVYIDEVRYSSVARSADWIATEYNNQNDPASFESFGMEQSNVAYASPNSTSANSGIINTVWNGGWGTPNGFSSTVTIPSGSSINFQMRSSATGGSIDNDWTAWSDLGTATTTGTFTVAKAAMPQAITTGTNKYIQVLATPSSNSTVTATLSDYTVSYMADATAPSNPTTTTATIGGTAMTTSTWTPLSGAVNFTFSGSSDGAAEESGLAGYYTYFGTDPHADPSNYQAHSGAVGDNQTFSTSTTTTDDGKYFYFRIKTKDIAGNISPATTLFDFGYDITSPSRPSFVASDPAGYTTNNSFNFSWPAAEDVKTAGGWYSNSWTKRQKITFDKDKVPNTDQTDFPVLVKITDTNNELFTTAKTNGYDILFTSANGTTKLSHEIEKYDATTKELWAWVKLPVLSHSTDTNIYMYYGNSAATNQQNKTDVWSNGYAGVWHLSDPTNPSDSTSNANNGINHGSTATEGQVGNAGGYDGSGFSSIHNSANLQITSQITISAWVNSSNTAENFGMIVSKGADSCDNWNLRFNSTTRMPMFTVNAGGCGSYVDHSLYSANIQVQNNTWGYVNGTYDGSVVRTFVNDNLSGSFSRQGTVGTNFEDVLIGKRSDGYNLSGKIDEVRISSTARSADWIATEYANQNDPESFMTVSPSSGGSDIKYYEYKRATAEDTDWSHTADGNTRTVSGITAYREGANAFYVRSVDNAGNTSNYQQVTYYWSGNAPAKPTNLSVSPETSDVNEFTISWDKSATEAGDPIVVGYYYSINAAPTVENITYIASQEDHISIGNSPFATKQGTNIVYVLGVNAAGNLSFDEANVASATFVCQTPAPPAPVSVSLDDSSDRAINRWMLTTQWSSGLNQDQSSFDHYSIERSTDPNAANGQGFTHLANTTSLAYIDSANLNNTTAYSYRIKAVDSAGKESAPSSIVSRIPSGKYLAPPTMLSQPEVTGIKSNEATVAWTTDRASTSVIKYGTKEDSLDLSTGNFENVASHKVSILGINSSTKYYFKVQSLDEDRDYDPETAFSTIFTFQTLDAPAISGVVVENITLTTADISFQTTTVSNSVINYGITTSYDKSIEDKSGEGTISHKVKLSNLASGTIHHFKVKGTDIDGNNLVSDDYSFKTLEPPKAENIKATPIEGEPTYTVKLTWTSNVETTTILNYSAKGADTKESVSSKLSKDHEVTLKDLLDNTTYAITATGRDQFGNEATASSLSHDTPSDSRPPKIDSMNVESNIHGNNSDSKSQIIVSWHTDEPSTSQVEYGEGTGAEGYGSSSQEHQSLSKDHLVIISDLDNQKPYHLRAVSKDASNNTAYSENTVVVTKKPKLAAFNLILDTLSKSFGFLNRIFGF